MADTPQPTDWEAIEREYRAGQLSVREIARLHGVSHTAINKKAKAQSWTQNLAQRVREEVSTRLVSDEVSSANAREAIDAAAARAVDVIRSHRRGISTALDLVGKLMAELTEGTEERYEIEEEIEEETKADRNPKRRNAMLRAVALPSRASVIMSLSSAMKNLVTLERQAFNLGSGDDGGDGDRPPVELSPNEAARRIAFALASAGREKK